MQISAVCLVQESRNAAHAEHVYLYKAVWDPDGCDSVWPACVCVCVCVCWNGIGVLMRWNMLTVILA